MNLVIVLKTLCDLEENFKKSLKKNIEKLIEKKKLKSDGTDSGKVYSAFFSYFENKIGSIEIINAEKRLQKIYFVKRRMTDFLPTYNKEKFMDEVNRESANEKTSEMLEKYIDFYEEMKHYQRLDSMNIPFKISHIGILKTISLLLVLVVNISLLGFNLGPERRFNFNQLVDYVIYIIGFIIMIIYGCIFSFWLILNA